MRSVVSSIVPGGNQQVPPVMDTVQFTILLVVTVMTPVAEICVGNVGNTGSITKKSAPVVARAEPGAKRNST